MGLRPASRKLSWGTVVLLWLLQEEAVGSSPQERKGAGWTQGPGAIMGAHSQIWGRKTRETTPEDKRTQISQDFAGRSLTIDTLTDNETQIVAMNLMKIDPVTLLLNSGFERPNVMWRAVDDFNGWQFYHERSKLKGKRKFTTVNAIKPRDSLFPGVVDSPSLEGFQVKEDNHSYYLSRMYGPEEMRAKELWVEVAEANRSQVKVHGILSNTHRQASRVILSFDFPFYGHYLRQVTIATGGFIFMGDVIHRMLTATQYIAPLMANFNPGYSRNSTVKYFDNGTVFVVQWDQVYLEGKEHKGCFIFQAALHNDGRIVFGYKEIPMSVLEISSTQHPVKAGLSDAFMILNSSPGVPETHHRTIYEYHRVELDISKITSASAVEFLPLPTCLQLHNCEVCMTSGLNFNCSWCHVLQRCSSGFDRYREEWLEYGCGQESEEKTCPDFEEDDRYMSSTPNHSPFTPLPEDTVTTSSHFVDSLTTEDDTKLNQNPGEEGLRDGLPTKKGGSQIHTGTIVGILLAVLLIAALILAGIYITSNPTSSAALFFIERRPHQWPTMKFRNRSTYTEVEPSGQEKDSFVEADQC